MTRFTATTGKCLRQILHAACDKLGTRPCGWRAVCRGLFYAMLGLLIFADLLSTALKAGQHLTSGRMTSGVTPLDSFSEPAIAAAILKHKAEASLFDYAERGNDRDPRGALGGLGFVARKVKGGSLATFVERPNSEHDAVCAMEELHTTLRDLVWDLDQKLLLIYWTSQCRNEFLDLFLQVLQVRPERAEVLSWLAPAFECAWRSGRGDELEDALHHAIRFHGQAKTASELKTRLEAWKRSTAGTAVAGER